MKVYMYANGHLIKKIKVPRGENVFENVYIIKVIGKRYIFGSNFIQIAVRPIMLIKNIEGEIHVSIKYEEGEKV